MNDYFEEIGAWPGESRIARSYAIGFAFSLVATIAAYALTLTHALPPRALIAAIFALAGAQILAQLAYFLHLGSASGARMRTIALIVTFGIVSILVAGSLWIMATLNSRMMPSQNQMIDYMQNESGL